MSISHDISLILVLVVNVLAFVIGLLVGKGSPKWIKAGMAIATLLIVLRFTLLRNPQIEYHLFEGNWYSAVRPWWGFPPAMFLTGAAIFQVKRFSVRVLAKAAAAIVFYVAPRTVVASLMMDHSERMENFPDPNTGLVAHKTLYSCGAACAAMLLHFEGIQASEGEMATICRTNAATATDEFNVRRGLREKLAGTGKNVVIEHLDFESLLKMPNRPFMAVIEFQHLLDHWVVVESISDDQKTFRILDPKGTIIEYTKANFKAIWKNRILFIE